MMIGYMTPRTTVTPPVPVPDVEKKAMDAAIMAANRKLRRQRVQAKIDQNMERYDALSKQEKIEFWLRGDFAPKKMLQVGDKRTEGQNGGFRNKKLAELTLEAVLEFIGDGEKTANHINTALNPYRGRYAAAEVCRRAVADGILKIRVSGPVEWYSVVKK